MSQADPRPADCRNRLRDSGQSYPQSGHLGPSMEDKSVPGNVRLAPPIPTYALRAMLSLVP